MKYLVTGAAGFVGSHLTDALLAAGHDVISLDNLSSGQDAFLDSAHRSSRFTFVRGDILDATLLRRTMDGVDAVYHMAANADVRGSFASPRTDLEQNTLGTFEVLEAMRHAGTRRIIFASSAAALGEPEIFPTPEDCPIPAQTSLYGASKMACEGLVAAYCEGYGFEGDCFRFVSLLGPRYPHGHVFDFVKQLLADPTRLQILGDGTQRKSYLHVEDCVRAILDICNLERHPQTVVAHGSTSIISGCRRFAWCGSRRHGSATRWASPRRFGSEAEAAAGSVTARSSFSMFERQ